MNAEPCRTTVQLPGGAFHHGRIVTCQLDSAPHDQHCATILGYLADGHEVQVEVRWST